MNHPRLPRKVLREVWVCPYCGSDLQESRMIDALDCPKCDYKIDTFTMVNETGRAR